MTDKKKDFIDSTFRKKWDKDYFEQRAKDREAGLLVDDDDDNSAANRALKKAKPAEELTLYKARDQDLNLKSRLGKKTIIEGVTPIDQQGGLYCELCERAFKDSSTFLDHFNGKRHTRLSGSSMHVPQASLSQVQAKLQQGKESLLNKKTNNTTTTSSSSITNAISKSMVAQSPAYKKIMEAKAKAQTLQQQQQNEHKEKEIETKEDDKKKDIEEEDKEHNTQTKVELEDGEKKLEKENINRQSTNTKKDEIEEKKEVEEEEVEEEDEETKMMKMMGIPSNFGSSKKG